MSLYLPLADLRTSMGRKLLKCQDNQPIPCVTVYIHVADSKRFHFQNAALNMKIKALLFTPAVW